MKVKELAKVEFVERELTFLEKLKRALPNVVNLDDFRGRRGRRGTRGETGDVGEQGPQGVEGPQGERGYEGMQGADGKQGEQGEQGERGKRGYKGIQGRAGESIVGPPGMPGPKGDKGETGDAPDHEWQGKSLRFRKPNGQWGRLVDLLGPAGSRGGAGKGGGAKEQFGLIQLNGNNLEFLKQGAMGPDYSVDLSPIATGEELNAQRTDEEAGGDVIYVGEAAPGTADSASLWRIKRVTFTLDGDGDTDSVTEWADGDSTQNNIWDDRLTLSYS